MSGWVEDMEREIHNNIRTCEWKELLANAGISQPYSHKIRQARADIKNIADAWMNLPSYDDANKGSAKKADKAAPAKKADKVGNGKMSAKAQKVAEANKARIKKANEKKNGMKKGGKNVRK
ncbi:hypothetical protein R83H12_01072 [Fibrobacteria bacterium R8-3-H12]